MPTLSDQIEAVVATMNLGTATAVKRGRNPTYPYVPVIDYGTHTMQLRGLAYQTRDAAVARAQKNIDAHRRAARMKLNDPRFRAYREQFYLPAEIGTES